MTEVPEYLLRRSRERREALGLAPKGESGGAPSDAPPPAQAAEPAAAGPAPAAGVPESAAVAVAAPTEDLPAYVAPAAPRSGVPVWMMPVLIVLPLWAVVYVGSFGTSSKAAGPPQGSAVYQKAGCGGCHGAKGEGGVGPALAGGDAKITFPNEADHIAWVENGSAPSKGKPYGDPNRPGGQRVATSGGMPSFKGQLTPAEIQAVVQYEREQL